MRRRFAFTAVSLLAFSAVPALAEVVGRVGVDWTGNDVLVDAISDPAVSGVTCYVTYFDRSIIDRLHKGNWFEDPSNNAISCQQTGPISIDKIDLSQGGEEVFRAGRSLVFKKLVVTRIYDKKNDALIYLAHSRELTNGSAKMSISTVPLYNQNVTWKNGKPQ